MFGLEEKKLKSLTLVGLLLGKVLLDVLVLGAKLDVEGVSEFGDLVTAVSAVTSVIGSFDSVAVLSSLGEEED